MFDLTQEQFEDLKELIKARIMVMSPDVGISIGSSGSMNKGEMISHIDANDDIGKKLIEINWQFIQSLKTGEIYKDINEYSKNYSNN